MFKVFRPFLLFLPTFLSFLPVSGSDAIAIHVHLFRGYWTTGHLPPKEMIIWTPQSHPEIASLSSKLDGPQEELSVSIIDTLIAADNLKGLDEYFNYAEEWNGRSGIFPREIEHKDYRFKFVYGPKRLSPESLELKVSLFLASGKGGRMDRLLDTKLILHYGVPVVVTMPYEEGAFFALIYINRPVKPEKSGQIESRNGKSKEITPPKALTTLMPAYPDELRQKGARGQVDLRVTIDEKGEVVEAKVNKGLHPYLDFAAVQAIRRWTFEPAMKEGKPVLVTVTITLKFDPEIYRQFENKAENNILASAAQDQSAKPALANVLIGVGAYCDEVKKAALEFICRERINETHYNFSSEPKWGSLIVASRETGQVESYSLFPLWDPQQTIRSNYICDYLFVKKGDQLEERRIVLEDDGRKMPDRNRLLEEKRFTALNPLLAITDLFSRDRQDLFDYRIIESENILGENASIIEATPKSGNTRGIEYAKTWVDSKNCQIIKTEIQGVPIEGYDDVLRDCVQFRVRPYLLTTHVYEFEKNGIRFPGRSTIRVEYPKRGDFYKNRTLKLKIKMIYEKYQFFTVETEGMVRKSAD